MYYILSIVSSDVHGWMVNWREEEEENLFAKWITYKLNQINAKGGLPEEQTHINAGRPYNLTIM